MEKCRSFAVLNCYHIPFGVLQGLKPILFHTLDGRFTTEEVSVGAMGDSYYEYLLKVWLLTNKTQDMYRSMWEQAMDDMISSLLFESTPSRLKYIVNYGK